MRFDHLYKDVGLAILIGVNPNRENLDMLIAYGGRRYLDREVDHYSPFKGIQMLDGCYLGLLELGAPEGGAEQEFEQLVSRFDLYLDYWNSGSHPERTPLSYFVDWARLKGVLPDWGHAADLFSISPSNAVEKPLLQTERNTLLTIIAALAKHSGINCDGRGAASQIAKLTEEIGAAVSDDAVRRALTKIPDALEARMK